MVLETPDQKESLYHALRLEILRALSTGVEDFETEVRKNEKELDDGTLILEEVTIRKPSQRYWMSVHEVLEAIAKTKPDLKISNYNCYYHLRKLRNQGLVEQYPPPKRGRKGDRKRVRGMFFRTTARFFVPTTFEISPDLAEQDVLPPEVTEKAVQLAQKVKETGRADAYEYQIKIGRTTYWFSVTMSLHDDGESIVSVVRDITKQRNTQEALRQSQERLDLALKGADLAPWDWLHTAKRMTFSDRYAEMLGFSLNELKVYADKWEELIHPDDLETVLQKWDDHLERRTPSYSSEHRMMTKHGHYIWVLDRGRVVERDEDGNPVRSAGTMLDVTHEKVVLQALDQSEERYRRLVNDSNQGIAIFVAGNLVFANTAYTETVGRPLRDLLEMTPESIWNIVHPDDRPELERRNEEIVSGAKSLPHYRFRYIRPNGEERWVDSYAKVVDHDGRRALQVLEVDVTEQYKAENELRESERRFKSVFELSPIGIILLDQQGKIIQLNQAAKDILGVSDPKDYENYSLEADQNIPPTVLIDIREGDVNRFEVDYDLQKAGLKSKRREPIRLQVIGIALNVSDDGTVNTYLAQILDVGKTENQS